MSNLIVVGIVLALGTLIAYIATKLGAANSGLETEKATDRETRRVADNKIAALEELSLAQEATTRAAEREAEKNAEDAENVTRSATRFYPDRLRKYPKDPNDLN